MENVTVKNLGDDNVEGMNRKWYQLNGVDSGTNYKFENDEYAICSDGSVLDISGCPLTEGDHQIIAVRNTIG